MNNKILVAYTTKYGATSGIAKKIGEVFELVQYAHSDINVSSSINSGSQSSAYPLPDPTQ